jgi:hypothetical protein
VGSLGCSGAIDAAAPRLVAYGISKVGVVQLTRTLAVELGGDGVRVNAIAPGLVETDITRRHYARADGSIDEEKRAAVLESMRAPSPLGLIGTPEDVGWAALYLASDAYRHGHRRRADHDHPDRFCGGHALPGPARRPGRETPARHRPAAVAVAAYGTRHSPACMTGIRFPAC